MRTKWFSDHPYATAGLLGAFFGGSLLFISFVLGWNGGRQPHTLSGWVSGIAFVLLLLYSLPILHVLDLIIRGPYSSVGYIVFVGAVVCAEWAMIFAGVRWLVRDEHPRSRLVWYALAFPVLFFLTMGILMIYPLSG